jgi:hypothetical protein
MFKEASLIGIHNIIDFQDSSASFGYNVPLDYIDETTAGKGSSIAKHLLFPLF